MFRTSDSAPHSIYRVNVVFSKRFKGGGVAAVNVKASSPSAAAEWLVSYPQHAGLGYPDHMEVTHAYKLRRQPVWLKKAGTDTARFDARLIERA